MIARAEGNQSHAAEMLGINRNTLHPKLQQHGLCSRQSRISGISQKLTTLPSAPKEAVFPANDVFIHFSSSRVFIMIKQASFPYPTKPDASFAKSCRRWREYSCRRAAPQACWPITIKVTEWRITPVSECSTAGSRPCIRKYTAASWRAAIFLSMCALAQHQILIDMVVVNSTVPADHRQGAVLVEDAIGISTSAARPCCAVGQEP